MSISLFSFGSERHYNPVLCPTPARHCLQETNAKRPRLVSRRAYQYGSLSSSNINSLSLGSIRTIWSPRLKNTKPESASSSQILCIACSEHPKSPARSRIVHFLSFTSSLSSCSSPSNYLRQPRIPEFDDSEVSHHTIAHNSSVQPLTGQNAIGCQRNLW